MTDDRDHLRTLLDRYAGRWPGESATTDRIRRLVDARADCFERTCFAPGHVTGSAMIVSPDREACLLTHHKKLGRWLQQRPQRPSL